MSKTNDTVELTTRSGLQLFVRRAEPHDAPTLTTLFRNVKPEELRFRFLTALKEVGAEQIKAMTSPDRTTIDSYIAFALDGEAVATAMLACDDKGERGEVAICVHGAHHNEGIGWTLLSFLADRAQARGLATIESIENRANRAAIEVERDSGFSAETYPGDPTLMLVKKYLK